MIKQLIKRGLLSPFFCSAIIFLSFTNCAKNNDTQESINNTTTSNTAPTPYQIKIPKGFPTILNIPANNPMTVEGIELGRLLFYDGRLAGRDHKDSLMSCASCHLQSKGFELGSQPKGITGIQTPHAMLPLFNLVWNNNGYLWNGKVSRLEDLLWMGVHAPHEMKSDTNRAKAMIQSIAMYPPLFKKAFGSETVTAENMGRAIAQFLRYIVSANSKFDKYLRGEQNLTPQEFQGYVVFSTEDGGDCFHCHGSDGNPMFTTNLFYNNGLNNVFTDPKDRYSITKDPKDIGAYRAPSIRNIALTAPYMHDGRFKTLEEVVDFYSSGILNSPSISPLMHHINTGGAQLTPTNKQALIAFLKTLTDSSFVNNAAYSNPRPNDEFFIKEK